MDKNYFTTRFESLAEKLKNNKKSYTWLFKQFSQIRNKAIVELPPYTFKVYSVLIMHAMRKKRCFPSYETIAKEGKISKRQAIYEIEKLIELKYIRKESRFGKSNYFLPL